MMNVLITGSAGHLGEALVRTLTAMGCSVTGIDILSSPCTNQVGSIADRQFVKRCMKNINAVLHTATLHKPHIVTHTYQDFIDTNISGTLNLLEEAVAAGVSSFVYTSTTSTFGDALTPPAGSPAVWITEDVLPLPKNIYGTTKTAAEDLCRLFYRNHRLACIVLKTARFFPEEDDQKKSRQQYEDGNLKANEFLYRRADIEDVVQAHLLAMEKAVAIGFGRYIISATTPFNRDDTQLLATDAPQLVKKLFPAYETIYAKKAWKMFPAIERVYSNELARRELGWSPRYNFEQVLDSITNDKDFFSPLTRTIGKKGYHSHPFSEGPYPVQIN